MRDFQKSDLMKIAAEMVRGEGMPSEDPNDWPLPKSASQKLRDEIRVSSHIAQSKCREWSAAIMKIVRELPK